MLLTEKNRSKKSCASLPLTQALIFRTWEQLGIVPWDIGELISVVSYICISTICLVRYLHVPAPKTIQRSVIHVSTVLSLVRLWPEPVFYYLSITTTFFPSTKDPFVFIDLYIFFSSGLTCNVERKKFCDEKNLWRHRAGIKVGGLLYSGFMSLINYTTSQIKILQNSQLSTQSSCTFVLVAPYEWHGCWYSLYRGTETFLTVLHNNTTKWGWNFRCNIHI